MEFKTKYNHGDTVYMITRHMTYKIESCPTCNNLGKVEINGESFTCPNCRGYSKQIADKEKWELYTYQECGIIGRITAESYDKKYCVNDKEKKLKFTYMVDVTGIGTGSIWDENNLFLTREEAITECERRNNYERPK